MTEERRNEIENEDEEMKLKRYMEYLDHYDRQEGGFKLSKAVYIKKNHIDDIPLWPK